MTRFHWTTLILLAFLLGSGWIANSRIDKVNRAEYDVVAPMMGHLAPNFTLNTLTSNSMTLQTYLDAQQPVVVNFWATWCGPCRREMPHLQSVSEQYAEQVAILGVNQAETAVTVTEFTTEYGITYPILLDTDGRINNLYGVNGLPMTVFINREGRIVNIITGTLSEAVLAEQVERLLTE